VESMAIHSLRVELALIAYVTTPVVTTICDAKQVIFFLKKESNNDNIQTMQLDD
jgi:hypothetical protein